MGTARKASETTDDFEAEWNKLAKAVPGPLQDAIKGQFVQKWNETHPEDPRDKNGRRAGRVEVNAKSRS
jgi:hypothetical protein